MNKVAIGVGEMMPIRDKNKTPKVVPLVLKFAESGEKLTADQQLQSNHTADAAQNIANGSNRLSHSDFREDP